MKKFKLWTLIPLSLALIAGCQQKETKETTAEPAAKEEVKQDDTQTEAQIKKTEPEEKEVPSTSNKQSEEADVKNSEENTQTSSGQSKTSEAITTIEKGAYFTMAAYLNGLANAVSQHDYSQVMNYITPDTPLASSVQMIMSDLNSKHTSEELVSFDVISIKKSSTTPEGEEYIIQTHEVFLLTNEDTGKHSLKEYDYIYNGTLLPNNLFRLNLMDVARNPVEATFSEEERKRIEQSGLNDNGDTTKTNIDLTEYKGFWTDKAAKTPVQLEFEPTLNQKARVKVNYGNESSTGWQEVTFKSGFGSINYTTDGTGASGNVKILVRDGEIIITIESSTDKNENPSALPSGAYILYIN